MPTIRMSGTITAKSPILITRPEQGDVPLLMNVIRNEALVRAYAIPGETIKGLLRGTAYAVCVDAGRQTGDLRVTLDSFYRQTLGGMTFTSETREIGSDAAARQGEPLLSLFGAASPKLCGRIIVHHAIAQTAIGSAVGLGLPPGMRRDGIATTPEFADLFSDEEKAMWSRQNSGASRMSLAARRVDDAKRILGRARKVDGADVAQLEGELKVAQDEVEALKADPEFKQTVQRPLPTRNAAPAGTVYDHSIEVVDASLMEIGLLFATFDLWNQSARIGGGKTTGYGWIEAQYAVERLSDGGLNRNRSWVSVGTVTIGGSGPVFQGSDPVVEAAKDAWAGVEREIRKQTKVFA